MATNEDTKPAPTAPSASAAAPSMPAGKDTVENWAKKKGLLPEFNEIENPRNPRSRRPKAKLLQIHNKNHAPFRAARDVNKWPIGMELTEAEFDKAIAAETSRIYR